MRLGSSKIPISHIHVSQKGNGDHSQGICGTVRLAQGVADVPDRAPFLLEIGKIGRPLCQSNFLVKGKSSNCSEHWFVRSRRVPKCIRPVFLGVIEVKTSNTVKLIMEVPLTDTPNILSVWA
jgi:hypothetical protein